MSIATNAMLPSTSRAVRRASRSPVGLISTSPRTRYRHVSGVASEQRIADLYRLDDDTSSPSSSELLVGMLARLLG